MVGNVFDHMQGCHYVPACDPTHWHTHRGKDKNQVQLELKTYFDKLMHIFPSTHWKISADTMHQYVFDLATLKTMMCVL